MTFSTGSGFLAIYSRLLRAPPLAWISLIYHLWIKKNRKKVFKGLYSPARRHFLKNKRRRPSRLGSLGLICPSITAVIPGPKRVNARINFGCAIRGVVSIKESTNWTCHICHKAADINQRTHRRRPHWSPPPCQARVRFSRMLTRGKLSISMVDYTFHPFFAPPFY